MQLNLNAVETFDMFLKSVNAYDAFYAMKSNKYFVAPADQGEDPPADYLLQAFAWDDSPLGADYWISIQKLWREFLAKQL